MWKGVFSTVVLDKGHKLKHPWTRSYAAVKGLEANYHRFLTVTPVVNNSKAGDLSQYQHGKTLMRWSRIFLGSCAYCGQRQKIPS